MTGKGETAGGGRRRRRLAAGGVVVLALAGLVWWAPAIVAAWPWLRCAVLTRLARGAAARITAQSASLAWLSPVRLESLAVWDPQGRAVLEAAEVRTDQPLWRLLTGRGGDAGRVVVRRPVLRVAVDRRGRTNLERPLLHLLARPRGRRPAFDLRVTEGSVRLSGPGLARPWRLSGVDAACRGEPGAAGAITANVQAALETDEAPAGALGLDLQWRPGREGQAGGGRLELDVDAKAFPLELVNPVLRRLNAAVALRGRLTGVGRAWWSGGDQACGVELESPAEASGLELSAARWLADPQLSVERAAIGGRAERRGGVLALDGVRIESDAGRLELSGRAPLRAPGGGGPAWIGWARAAADAGRLRLAADVDVARIASLAPNTLRLRRRVDILAGRLRASLEGQRAEDGRRWSGRVELDGLAAQYEGRRLQWDEPWRAELALRDGSNGLVVEQADCRLPHLQAAAEGGIAQGRLSLEADLSGLWRELGQLIALPEAALAGRLSASAAWRRTEERRVEAEGRLACDELEVDVPGRGRWREPRLQAQWQAAVTTQGAELSELATAELQLTLGDDALQLAVRSPVANPSLRRAAWPLRFRLEGDLAAWTARLRPLLPDHRWRAEGRGRLVGEADVEPGRLTVRLAEGELAPLRLTAEPWRIDEPRVRVEAEAEWDEAARRLRLPTCTLASSALAFRADGLTVARSAGAAWRAAGSVSLRADLARLSRWLAPLAASPPPGRLAGAVEGVVRFDTDREGVAAEWSLVARDAAWAPRPPGGAGRPDDWPIGWREEQVRVAGQGRIRPEQGSGRLERLEVKAASGALDMVVQGQWAPDAQGRPQVALQGDAAYDWERLVAWLAPWLGPDVRITGRGRAPLRLHGPLAPAAEALEDPGAWTAPPELAGQMQLDWGSAAIYGLRLGPGRLRVVLENGVAAAEPLDVALSDGRARLAPSIDLRRRPFRLEAAPGVVLERVRLTEPMCRGWLKYVAPLLAEATSAEGVLSLRLERAAAPLAQPEQADIQGVLTFHEARVGPGPLTREFLAAARRIRALAEGRTLGADGAPPAAEQWLVLPEQDVAFRVRDGMVVHDRLEVRAGQLVVRTSGQVGLDQTLNLVVEIPVADSWAERRPLLAALAGPAVRIPIRGRLSSPEVDMSGMRRLVGRLLEDVGPRLLEQQLERGLERLFAPPP